MYKINLFNSIKKFVILAKAGIQCFQCVLDPPVKPEDDKSRVYTQTPYKYTIVSKNKVILDIRSFSDIFIAFFGSRREYGLLCNPLHMYVTQITHIG